MNFGHASFASTNGETEKLPPDLEASRRLYCDSCASPEVGRQSNDAELSQIDFSLRRRVVSLLVSCAHYDFHKPSETHLFFLQYAPNDLVRAVHPIRTKAFEHYVLSANKLVATNQDNSIREWATFIEGSYSLDQVFPIVTGRNVAGSDDFPCSGVINVKLNNANDTILEGLSSRLSLSWGKLSLPILENAIGTLDDNTRTRGIGAQGVEVRCFMDTLASARQRTIRIEKRLHASLIGKAHELAVPVSALASYLFHLYLIRVKSAESLVPHFR